MNENSIFEMSRAGVLPDTTADCTDRIGAVLAENEENVTYLFEKGVYRFHASNGLIREYSLSNTDGAQYERTLSLLIKDRKNITIDGGGATFVFYGHLQPFTIDGCENITLKNLVIDWEKPLVSEGEIVGRSADFIDVRINQNLFPCRVRDYSMYFDIGDGEESELTYGDHTIYDPDTLRVTPRSSDTVKVKSVEALSDDTFRLYTDDILPPGSPPRVGDLIVLRHNKHIHSGIFAENSTGIICENLTLYSCGEGLLFQFCRDVTCRNITIAPNRGIGRKIACSRDYGIQVSGCGGALTIEGCRFHGLQDDPVNIHSVGVRLDRINEDGTLTGSFARPGISNFRHWAKTGHALRFIDRRSMKYIGEAKVGEFTLLDRDTFRITPDGDIPKALAAMPDGSVAIENFSDFPSVTIRNCCFGSGRARGIVVMTPMPVRIEDNVFESPGAAIAIAGDTNFWFAPGASRNVTIRHNTFTDSCFVTPYEYSEAVITIFPDIPRPSKSLPYHSGISITDNAFLTSGVPVLFAFSVSGLDFTGNRLFGTERGDICGNGAALLRLINCVGADISGNVLNGVSASGFVRTESGTHTRRWRQ